jgi:hypothetical protein
MNASIKNDFSRLDSFSYSLPKNKNICFTWTYGGMQFPKLSVPEHRVHNKESPRMNLCPHPVALKKREH